MNSTPTSNSASRKDNGSASADTAPTLAQLQQAMLNDIYQGTSESLPYIEEAHHNRLNIFKNNTQLGLTELLGSLYPVIRKIVGEDFFKQLAHHYIKAHPLLHGNSHDYGEYFCAFINEYEAAKHLPYLHDVALVEWAFFYASLASEHPRLTFDHLTDEALNDIAFTLTPQPFVGLIPLTYNGLELWQAHQNDPIKEIELRENDHTILIWRAPDFNIFMQRLTHAESSFLLACSEGQSLQQCLSLAAVSAQTDAEMQMLQSSFAEFISNGLFVDESSMPCPFNTSKLKTSAE